MSPRRRLRAHLPWLGIPISSGALFLAFRGSDALAIWQDLAAVSPSYVGLAAVLMADCFALMALRWRLLLQPIAPVEFRRSFSLLAIGYVVNYFVPGRLGEIARSYLLGSFVGASRVAVLATVLVEKIVDGLVLLALLALLMPLVPLPSGARQLGAYGSVIFLGIGGALVGLRLYASCARRASQWTIGRVPRIGLRLVRLLDTFVEGLATIEVSRRTALVVLLSIVIWGQQALVMHALMLALGIELPPYSALVLLVALALGSMVPSAPGFIGTYQLIAASVLTGFGASRTDALAFSVLMHSTEYAMVAGAGIVGLALERLSLYRLIVAIEPTGVSEGQPEA